MSSLEIVARGDGPDPGGPGPQRIVYPENPRYRRIRFLARLLDQSIVLPNGYRIGLDPLLGFIPGLGDWAGAAMSCYLVYESARLGVPKRVLGRMLGNVAVEAFAGSFPILGDLFDMVWKANVRNLRLLDQHYQPSRPERPAGRVGIWILLFLLLCVAGMAALTYLVLAALAKVFLG